MIKSFYFFLLKFMNTCSSSNRYNSKCLFWKIKLKHQNMNEVLRLFPKQRTVKLTSSPNKHILPCTSGNWLLQMTLKIFEQSDMDKVSTFQYQFQVINKVFIKANISMVILGFPSAINLHH